MAEDFKNPSKIAADSPVTKAELAGRMRAISDDLSHEDFIENALETFQSPLIGYASTLLNDLDLARDVVQDTFIRLCQQDRSKVADHLKSWLFTVCRNRAFDILRKDKRNQPLDENHSRSIPALGLQPDEKIQRQEQLQQLTTYLDRLTSNQREVIILKFQHDLSYQEIHKITGLTSSNIGFLIHTGLKRLREILPEDVKN